MAPKIRRLAADHAALHEELPPNYLFPSDDSSSDDLSQLTTLLAGPQGTPYSKGLWRLHLKIPDDYPKNPPKATFKTRIWHPNVDETTGAVCVDTLKRDWKTSLTLKDVLVTISCLLIYPNPDSALNSTAGSLLQENYDAFAHQAKLMTTIHAPIPPQLMKAVTEAKTRGEESGTSIPEKEDSRCLRSRKGTRVQSLTMKKRAPRKDRGDGPSQSPMPPNENLDSNNQVNEQLSHHQDTPDSTGSDDENENLANASKENDPSLSPSPVKLAPPSPRKNVHGKRPLSVLAMPTDFVDPFMEPDEINTNSMTASERNIAANYRANSPNSQECESSPQRKSPKLSVLNRGINAFGRIRDDVKIYEDIPDLTTSAHDSISSDGKENQGSLNGPKESGFSLRKTYSSQFIPIDASSASSSSIPFGSRSTKPMSRLRKVSAPSSKKSKPRIGIRRL